MGRVFTISDLHLSHKAMAIKRGFVDHIEHDEHIIKCWNAVITKRDVVYILGDLTMESSKPYYLLDRLNGIKKVILGNHDKAKHITELLKYVNSVCGMYKYKGFILTHAPIHTCEIERFSKNIHGHVHENTLDDDRYVNVSCEAINYTPMLFPTPIYEHNKTHVKDEHTNR